ncbi:MAG: FAD:protein FMN transferase [Deltaproteobacteria bacterium]|jgi:FAD:protein FMN transferase|nr:FAD:protein FMN transferase [Deltaproteobacteria bacterium]
MKHKKIIVIGVLAVLCIALIWAFFPRRYDGSFYPMGGIPFKVVAYGKNFIQFDRIMEAVENDVAKLEKIFSRYDRTSELSKLNEIAERKPVQVSKGMHRMIALSKKWYRMSGGAFDPSVAPLVNLWKRAGKSNILPSDDEIAALLKSVGMDKVDMLDGDEVFFAAKGMKLDFGAIAKGFIVDRSVSSASEAGNESGLIEAGGDAYIFVEDSTKIGVQDPTDSAKLMATVSVSAGAVVTSGDYERYVEIDGKKYSHIVDPRTGYPSDNGVISVTVVGGAAVDADALATSVMVLGVDGGIGLVRKLADMHLIIVEKNADDYLVHVSKQLLPIIEWHSNWSDKVSEF